MTLQSHLPSYRQQLDALVLEGRAMLVATNTADTGTTPTLVQAQAGEVVIITKIVGTCLGSNDTSPGLGDIGSAQGFRLYDENGDVTNEQAFFLCHELVNTAFGTPTLYAEQTWVSAPPNTPLVWEPQFPIIVPPGHTLRGANDVGVSSLAGGAFACYGYCTDVGTARTLGFAVGTQDVTHKAQSGGVITSTKVPNATGFCSAFISQSLVSGVATVVAARAGYCIQVCDVVLRTQPLFSPATTRIAELVTDVDGTTAALAIAGGTQTRVFVATNNNHHSMGEWKFYGGFYLEEGKGLYLSAPAPQDILSPTSVDVARATCTVTYRYVPISEVPQGSWWGYKSVTPAGLSAGTVGTNSLFTAGSTDITLFYAGREAAGYSATTATTPGTGFQHVVEGYAISAQKDSTVPGDRCYFAITEGTTAGNVGVSGSGLSQANKLITPIMCLGGHDQMMAIAVDGLNVPCLKDTGVIRVEHTGRGSGSSTPATNDLDIDEWHVLVWGRTIPARHSEAHFRGGAS